MRTIFFLLEEPSAKDMIEAILPRLLPNDVAHKCISFEGKRDLEKQLVRKIRYWNTPNSCFLIMRDQDSEDCCAVKEDLRQLVLQTGKIDYCVIRIACHELESFFLGDLAAVEQGLGLSNISRRQNSKKFRDPDNLANAAEEMKKLNKGFYSKIDGAKKISPFLKLDGSNRSTSFNQLIRGIYKAIAKLGDSSECN